MDGRGGGGGAGVDEKGIGMMKPPGSAVPPTMLPPPLPFDVVCTVVDGCSGGGGGGAGVGCAALYVGDAAL